MQTRKIILLLSFVIVVGLLFTVVFMAKNQIGTFGRDYNAYVTSRVEKYTTWFTNRRQEVYNEVNGLAGDKLVGDLITALYAGEDTTPYATELDKVPSKVSGGKKVQILDPTGIVLYSTQAGEALVNRFVPELLTQAMVYQQENQKPFLRFLSTNEFLVVRSFNKDDKTCSVVCYYDAKRFEHPEYGLMVPWGKTLLVGKQKKGLDEAVKIVEYASVDPAGLNRGKRTIGGIKEVDGIQLVYFARYDRYVSPWVIGIIIFSFVLLFLILYAFFRLLEEEKTYRQPLTFRRPERQDLKDLVEDIEEGPTMSTEEARKGIEEMLMSDNIEDLTSSEEFSFASSVGEQKEPEPLGSSEMEMEVPSLDSTTTAAFGEGEAFPEISMGEETPSLPSEEMPSEEKREPSSLWETDTATRLFAEQDRILDEVEEQSTLSSAAQSFSLEPSFAVGEEEEQISSSPEEITLEPDFKEMRASEEFNQEPPPLEVPEADIFASSEGAFETGVGFPPPSETMPEEEITPIEEPVKLDTEVELLPLGNEEKQATESEALSLAEPEELTLPSEGETPSLEEISLEEVALPEIGIEGISMEEASSEQPPAVEEASSVSEALLEDIPPLEEKPSEEDEVIALNIDELSAIPVTEAPQEEITREEAVEDNLAIPLAEVTEASSENTASSSENKVMMFGEEVHEDLTRLLNKPPQRLSTIHDVQSYAKAAHDIAKISLGMSRVSILERRGDRFENIHQEGFDGALNLTTSDPLYQKILSKQKSIDIQGNLDKATYLKQWFKNGELKNLEELLIVPVVKQGNVVGIGIYGREKGAPEVSDLQKSELYNIGFLQEVE